MLFEYMKEDEFMARKETITKDYLFDTAFQMLREEGIGNITARKLAARAGCSTQPIFRLYENMEELWQELFERAVDYFEDYYNSAKLYDFTPFVNLGITYIEFAVNEKHLFQMLFLAENRYGKSLYEILNGKMGSVGKEFAKAKNEGCKNPGDLFMKMWIFIHGSACMSITGDYDLDMEETKQLLRTVYKGFLI